MKLGVRVNLGNYEQLSIESGECGTYDECEDEIIDALKRYKLTPVAAFHARVFKHREKEEVE